jgi:hypothetical protein
MLGIPIRYLSRHPIQALGAVASDPRETWLRIYDEYVYASERRRPPCAYEAVPDWERRLHDFLGMPWPCETGLECSSVWPSIISTLSARGVEVGPESYLHWNDGDPALVRAIWCLVRHRKPLNVVETGVAHGVSSRFILEAMKKNGAGRLWSIDLPTLEPAWEDHVGIAVGDGHRDRWQLIRGSSRRRLAPLLVELGTIDLFIHDSLHSARNVRFELDQAWAALTPGGAIIVDDMDANSAFRSFLETHRGHASLICEAEPFRPDARRFNQKGLFGIILKQPKAHMA